MSGQRTLYHLLFADLLKRKAPPGFEVVPELPLGTEPQRADFLLLRQAGAPRQDEKAGTLRRLWPLLSGDTIVEFKSPKRPVRAGDVARLLGYGAQYHAMTTERILSRSDLGLVLVVASWTPTLDRELASFEWTAEPLGDGYFAIGSHPYRLFVAVVDDVAVSEHDGLLAAVGHRKMRSPGAMRWLATLAQHFPEGFSVAELDDLDVPEEEFDFDPNAPGLEKLIPLLPKRLRLFGMTPEERLTGLSPEEQLLALSDDLLRQLPADLIDRQPPAVRDEIRRRISQH